VATVDNDANNLLRHNAMGELPVVNTTTRREK
jgi:hypothetical protein